MAGNTKKILLILIGAALVGAFFYFDLGQYLTLEALKEHKEAIAGYYQDNQALTIAAYMGIYILATALSLPGATILTLAGGALFGLALGTVLVSFASTIGATCAFLVARYLLRDSIQDKFGEKLKVINDGVKEEGAFYLFTMRLLPIFPFFVINLVMGLTPIKTATFFFVSQVGMLLGTIIYVNAGTELAQIDSLSGILSPKLLLSFALLGIFPLVAKKIVSMVKARRASKAAAADLDNCA